MTGDLVAMWKSIENLGLGGLIVYLIYKLADKWLPRFLDAQQNSATALASLATAVKEEQGDSREILMAVRLLADRLEAQKTYLMAIDDRCQERSVKA